MAGQFTNQANPQFHHDTTAAEIWEQMEGRVDGFVAGVGTGGTFSGVARVLKKHNPAVTAIAVETQGSILQGGAPGHIAWKVLAFHFFLRRFIGKCATA